MKVLGAANGARTRTEGFLRPLPAAYWATAANIILIWKLSLSI